MVNITSIFNVEYDAAIPWSRRKDNGQKNQLILKIRRILNLLSGNEMLHLLRDLIQKEERKFISKEYFNALKNLSEPINKIKKKNQHFFYRPMKMARLTRQELTDMDYQIGKELWSSCKKKNERLVGGRQKINESTIDSIKSLLSEHSQNNSFRLVKLQKRKASPHLSIFEPRMKIIKSNEKAETETYLKNVKTLNKPMLELKTNFDEQFLNNSNIEIQKIHYDTFRRYIIKEKNFKKSKNVSKK